MAKSSGKILVDPEIGEVVFRKSIRSRSISIRVHPVKGVSVSVPYIVPYAAAKLFFQARRGWILETMARQREKYRDIKVASPSEIDAMHRQAKAQLPDRLAELATRYGFTYNRVAIKHNASNWGSCSTKGNINLNLNIMRLPKVLQDYVLIHELCHLRHPDHGHGFHILLEHLLTDNIMKLLSDETLTPEDMSLTRELARKAAASRARYPLDYTITRAIKQYRVI
jgi:predicted metal-dependent hydrolase